MSDIKWGYQINQWKPLIERIVRREQQERAFKEMSACGFKGVELMAGGWRWEPLGDLDTLVLNFGSIQKFVDFLHSCAIDQIVSFYVPSRPKIAYSFPVMANRFASNPADHGPILDIMRPYARFLHDVGGYCLVVDPMREYCNELPVTPEKIATAAECWNKVGKMAKDLGIETAMHVDFLSALHGPEDIARILELTDPEYVGLAIDTAELTIAGIDPVKLYEEHHNRVKHFHFKDAHTTDTLGEYRNESADLNLYVDGGERGVERWFWEMGLPGGLVDFPALMKSIRKHNYGGWIIVESDQSPNPAESAMLNRWYIDRVLSTDEGRAT